MSADSEPPDLSFENMMEDSPLPEGFRCEHGVPLNQICPACAGIEKP